MLIAVALALGCFVETIIKRLGGTYPVGQVLFFRFFFSVPVLAVLYAVMGASCAHTARPGHHIGRAVVQLVAVACWFAALPQLSLGDATTLSFTMPLFLVLFSIPLLAEWPSIRQIAALGVGFVGVTIMAGPGMSAAASAISLVLLSSALRALSMIGSRHLARQDGTAVTVVWFHLTGVVICGLLLPVWWRPVLMADVPSLVMIGLFGGVSQILVVAALARAPTGQLAPIDYLRLPLAALLSWVYFADLPSLSSLVGAALIVGGAYLVSKKTGVTG